MKRKIGFLSIALMMLLLPGIQAGAQSAIDTLSLNVYFVQGKYDIDRDYRDNGKNLDNFINSVNSVLADPGSFLHAVVVEATASPEGGVYDNKILSTNRAMAIRRYICENSKISQSQVKAYGNGVDWNGLYDAVAMSDCPWKDAVMKILVQHQVSQVYSPWAEEKMKNSLTSLDGGKAWKWMMDNLFENLRNAGGRINCIITRRDVVTTNVVSRKDTVYIIQSQNAVSDNYSLSDSLKQAAIAAATAAATTTVMNMEQSAQASAAKVRGYKRDDKFRVPVFAFRTNLLMPAMTFGVEVPIGNRWTVSADVYYPWAWREWVDHYFDPKRYCIQGHGAYIDARCWLGKSHRRGEMYGKYRLCGHSLGLVLGGAYYDYEWDYKGEQGEALAAGLSYQYAVPLGKRGGTRLEFELAGGYYYRQYRPYTVHYIESLGEYHLIADGIEVKEQGFYGMRAAINLVVPIFKKDKAKTKTIKAE